MAGFGKNPRHGKRPPSSSSYFSTVSMVVLVAVCILGVWMLTSNSIIPSQATTHHHSRAAVSSNTPSSRSRKNPPPIIEDSQGDGEEAEEKPGSKLSISQQDSVGGEEESRSESSEKNEEDAEGRRGGEDTQQENLSGNEETQEQQAQETKEEDSNGGDGVVDEERKLQSDAQRSDEHQEEHAGREENQEETQVQQNEHGGEESQQETQNMGTESEESQQETLKIGTESEESQQETQQNINWENQQETHQEQMEKNGSENQGETQDQILPTNDLENQQETKEEKETENIVDISEQQSQTEMDENHDRNQREESSNGEKSSEEGGNEAQWQPEQQKDVEGSSEHQQDMDNRNSHGTSEENQQQGEEKFSDPNANDLLPDASQSEVPNDSDGKKRPWATQADQSESEKERRKGSNTVNLNEYEWELCNVTAGPDYIPCLDNAKAIKQLHGFKHYEHRERHCPEERPTCLVPLPSGYKRSIEWPRSRDQIWYNNVPHTKLAEVKGHQNWVKVTGDYLTFPGGGTQFIHGALHYIDFIQQSVHDIAWGKHTRVILDVGCGVASFGGYLFDRDVLAMSFAPKDEHEAQVQLALERGIPAISAVMGSQRLPFPGRVFDLVHCARCRVPWHADGGTLLLELNRVLRPGGYFVWSATPVYQRLKEDVEIWKAMKSLTISMCWDLIAIKKDKLNSVGAAFFRKPVSNECYDNRKHHSPPMCKEDDDPNAAWYIPLKACMHRVPVDVSERGSQWPEQWPRRVQVPPYWINGSQIGVYGKSAPDDFRSDYEHWKRVVTKSYLTGFGINWSKVRNVMDMRPVYGGFAAALKDLKVWVLNVVNIDAPDTLPIIFERGLFGIYHDWCESFSTYPRTYDLLHADHLFSQLNQRCKMEAVMAEVDRIVRPGGKLIVRDESRTISEIDSLLKSLHWEVRLTFSKDQEGILCAEKSDWRPEKYSDSS